MGNDAEDAHADEGVPGPPGAWSQQLHRSLHERGGNEDGDHHAAVTPPVEFAFASALDRANAGVAMSDLRDARHLLEMADRAAREGDLSSADELLRSAARIQEAALGRLHPDLISTLNNLAIVAERTGRPDDAETFYRRAAAIAAASLPPDHSLVAEARQNLENFCRELGRPITPAAVTTPSSPDAALRPDGFAPEATSDEPSPVPRSPAPTAAQPSPAPRRSSLEWVAIGAVVLVTVAVLVKRSASSREQAAAPTASQATEPAILPPTTPAPIEQAQPPTVVPRREDTPVATRKPSTSAPPSDAISLASVELCRTLSTSGSRWRCEPASDPVGPGRMMLYTRVRSPRDTAVVHRWYREDILQQAVKLTIRANPSEGYRTYSRQAVDVGNWRLEVGSADGNLLHEHRFTVR